LFPWAASAAHTRTLRGTGSSKLGNRSLQKFVFVRAAVFLFGAVIPTPGLAQSQPTAAFRFFQEGHWSSAARRPGDMRISLTGLAVLECGVHCGRRRIEEEPHPAAREASQRTLRAHRFPATASLILFAGF